MKHTWILCVGLWIAAAPARAEPPVSVSAQLVPRDASLFEHQVTEITLTVVARNIQLGRRLELRGLPESSQLRFGAFLEIPGERTQQGGDSIEIKRFRAELTALSIGVVKISPQLSCSVVKLVPSAFGSIYNEQQASVPVQPVTITIRPLPPQGRPPDFSGAVGTFALTATLEPTRVAPGDLVKATVVLSGSGWTNAIRAPAFSLPEHFRVYDPKPMPPQPGELMRWEQTVVPQTTNATWVPAVTFSYFDAPAGRYAQSVAGPFHLTFHDAVSAHVTPFAATGTVRIATAATNAVAPLPGEPSPTGLSRLPSGPGFWFAAAATTAFWLVVALLVYRLASRTRRGIASGAAILLAALALYVLALSAYRQHIGKQREQGIVRQGTQARFAPHQQATATFSVPAGATVEIAETHGAWVRIRHNDNVGWIPSAATRR